MGEDQNSGEDIEAKEEGIGWGMVTLFVDQHQVVQAFQGIPWFYKQFGYEKALNLEDI